MAVYDLSILERKDFVGTVNRFNRNIRYDQVNNGTEAIIRKVLAENNIKKGNLESCGVSALCCGQEAIDVLRQEHYFKFPSGKFASYDDAVMSHMNTFEGYESDSDRFDNRYARNYTRVVDNLFSECKAEYLKHKTFFNAVEEIKKGKAVQILLNEGHWICIIGYLRNDNELVFHDSWGSRPGNKNKGLFEKIGLVEYTETVMDFIITYEKITE